MFHELMGFDEKSRLVYQYYDTQKLSNGQTIKIVFDERETTKKFYYNIYLVIMDKKKSEFNTTLKQTGRCGLEGLLWAKDKIIEFEEFILEKNRCKPIVIYCYWDDNRRRDVYYRGLKNLGYGYSRLDNNAKVISKTIIT